MQVISTDKEHAFEVTPLQIAERYSETLAVGLSSGAAVRIADPSSQKTWNRRLPQPAGFCSSVHCRICWAIESFTELFKVAHGTNNSAKRKEK